MTPHIGPGDWHYQRGLRTPNRRALGFAHYKPPRRSGLVPALPRTPAVKVLKFEWRARIGGGRRPIG
jgi:hypothetical protein